MRYVDISEYYGSSCCFYCLLLETAVISFFYFLVFIFFYFYFFIIFIFELTFSSFSLITFWKASPPKTTITPCSENTFVHPYTIGSLRYLLIAIAIAFSFTAAGWLLRMRLKLVYGWQDLTWPFFYIYIFYCARLKELNNVKEFKVFSQVSRLYFWLWLF